MEDFFYAKIQFKNLKPVFTKEYSEALNLLNKIEKEKKEKSKEALKGRFLYIVNEMLKAG